MEIPEVPADYALPKVCLKPGNLASPFFMPPWASRTRKRVTGIRVEHGPEISEADAIAEGFSCSDTFEQFWTAQYGDDKPWRWVYDLGEVEG